MKRVSITILLALLISAANPFQVHATFPSKSIVFWDLGQSDEKKDKELMKAYDLATQKEYGQALAIIEQKMQKSPKQATLYVMKGLILNETRMYMQAIRALNESQMMEARHPGVHYGFCEVYRNLGMADLSLQACRVAEEIHIHLPESHYEYAQILKATGDMKGANQSLATAAELDPNNAQYHHERGMNFYYLNQYDDAEKSFQKALTIDPTDVDSGYQLAYIYAASKKADLAKNQIEKILKIRKEHPKLESAKILMKYIENNALDKLPLEIIPHKYHVGRSKSLYKSGQYGLALIEIETAAKLKPNDLKVKEIQIGLTGFLLRVDKTEKVVKEMIALAGEDSVIAAKGYQELGDIEVVRGHLPLARSFYEKALKLSDPNGVARQTLDELPEKAGPSTGPLPEAEFFIEPSEALNRKGEIFAQYKMYKRAIAMYSLVLRIKPQHLPSMLNTATTYYNSTNYGKAISILERLLISHPQHDDIITHHILLAQAYVKSGNRGKGLKNIDIAIKLNPKVKDIIKANPEFEPLRNMDEYKNLIK
ncbi:MAG: hypothetical protein CMH80_06630 [Nitrospinae bacterium]|nr:hypothetical protein [Nitrospinota bacterium]